MFNRDEYCQRYFMRKEAGMLSAAYNLGGKALSGIGNFINNRFGGFINKHFGNTDWINNAGNKLMGYGDRLTHKGNLLAKTEQMAAAKAEKAAG